MERLHIFSPATVANVSCGFDAMGFALQQLGDEMTFQKTSDKGEVVITKIEGAKLPFETERNAAGFVAQKMLEDAKADFGLEIEIIKKYKPGSGLGSSAASSAGSAYAVNQFLDGKFSQLELVKYGMLGEEVACGAQIADNVSAALYGGFVLIRSYDPLEIVSIPTPEDLFVTVLHPQIELKTEDGRNVLPKKVPLKDAVKQWSNVGGLISGLYTSDYELIGRSLEDIIVEPARKLFIPHFDAVKEAAVASGAVGAGISGSGPSIFALSKGKEQAQKTAHFMDEVYKGKGIEYNIYVSSIGNQGTRII
ncbi:homoserine kinase [Aureisphaera galaxeae]|uniref:homoserine kinase n=1 Tax=Aureisphaera galaxeae TaxID=1538023 RepID=UPI0023508EAA|nr:homoserine kinase [Aureisphaera galaxeae]MDC8003144.1 homoserine kinase [Aureisphaera galaxeae]